MASEKKRHDLSEHTVELKLPDVLGSEKIAISTAAAVAEGMGFDSDRIEALKTAIGEACLNAIEHGGGAEEDPQVLVKFLLEQNKLIAQVINRGVSSSFQTMPMELPDICEKMQKDAPVRGWGLYLIRNLMDHVELEVDPDTSKTQLTMVIHVGKV